MNSLKPCFLHKALKYDPATHAKLLKDRLIQEKLDGVGAQVLFGEDSIEIYAMTKASKSGEFSRWTDKLPHLVAEFNDMRSKTGFFGSIQGELMVDYFQAGNPNFGFVTGTLHADDSVARQEKYKIKFVAYEMPTHPGTYIDRYRLLDDLFKEFAFEWISLNPILAVNEFNNVELDDCFARIIARGGEGVVMYEPGCFYKHSAKGCQRNKGILKIKAENEREVLCTEMVEGEGKYVGTLGALICEDGEGRTFHIGSFLADDKERQRLWNTMKVPFIVEMLYFEQTEESYKLPRYKRCRTDKPMSDWNKTD